ncbi:MAG: GAF domain-containing protein [Caldilineaceae bacterium]
MDKPRTTIFAQLPRLLERPKAGAGAVFSALNTKKPSLPWMNVLFRSASWLLIGTVLFIAWLAHATNPFFSLQQIYGALTLYTLYVLLLEAASTWFKASYEEPWFRVGRVAVNYLLVTILISLSPRIGHYFWFFYSLPILQTIVYFRDRWVLLVGASAFFTYWLVSVGVSLYSGEPINFVPLVMNSLILGFISLILHWFFRSAKATQDENVKLRAEVLTEQERSQRLAHMLLELQRAGETIMLLAEQQEDWLWHALLTLATAHYGLRFERALLFLVEKDGHALSGRMGIGHFDQASALQDWAHDETTGMTFERYLQRLQAQELTPTPIEQFVCGWRFLLDPTANPLTTVLQTGEIKQIGAKVAQNCLPKEFVEKFGACDYALVPVKAGKRVLGLVILSSPFHQEPYQADELVYFATLANQAALVYENLRYRRAQKQLVDVTHQILFKAHTQPLKETLTQLCQAAQTLAEADLVAIYPLRAAEESFHYDFVNGGWVGRRQKVRPQREATGHTFTLSILDSDELCVIPNVAQHATFYNGAPLVEHQFIVEEAIMALIAVPVYDLRTKRRSGILYLNSRSVRAFTEQDCQLAESLAQLAAVAIRNWQDAQGLRDEKMAREEELELLDQVLRAALTYGTDEKTLIATLLDKSQELLKPLPVQVRLLLKRWRRADQPTADPVEVRYHYFLQDGTLAEAIQTNLYQGITGQAFKTGEVQNVPDVTLPQWCTLLRNNAHDTRAKLAAPIQLGEQIIGVLDVESPHAAVFTPAHEAALKRLAAAAALALDNVRRQEKLRILLRAANVVHGPTRLTETLKAIAGEIQRAVPSLSTLIIWHKDPKDGRLTLGQYFGVLDEAALKRETPTQNGTVRQIMESLKPIEAIDVQSDPFFKNKTFIRREKLRSTIAFPLRVQDAVIGAMFFSYRQPHTFTQEERALFPLLAEFVATSVNDALYLERTQREERRLTAALKITEAVGATVALDEMLSQILAVLAELYPKTTPRMMLYNPATYTLDFPPNLSPTYAITNPIYEGISGLPVDERSLAGALAVEALQTGEKCSRYVPNVAHESVYLPLRLDTQSALGVTLMGGEGEPYSRKLLGVLLLESTERNAFLDEDHEVVLGIARQTRIALERAKHSADLRFRSSVIGATSWVTPIVHDINRETGRIRRRIARLQAENHLSPNGVRYIDEIDKHVSRLSNIVAETSPGQEELQVIDIEKRVYEWVQTTVQERSVDLTLTYAFQTGGVSVLAHPRALQRVLHYLVRNALEAMGWKTGQCLKIRTALARDEQHIEIYIEDNGPGIEPDMQLRLFNQPISTKGNGRGFGLLFVRAAIEQMNGNVRLHSSLKDKGTVFALTLPIAETALTVM